MEPGGRGRGVHSSCASKIWGAWLEAGWYSSSTNIGIGIDINIWGFRLGANLGRSSVQCTSFFHTIFGGSGAWCDSVPEFSAMAACSNCSYLTDNSLEGNIPTELGLLRSLTQL